jgi:DedD protein
MRGAFDDEQEFEQQKSGGDAEFTLGAGTLLLLLAGLVVLCAVFFGLGYMAGSRRTSTQPADQPTASAGLQPSVLQQKPSATTQAPAPSPAQPEPQADSASQPAASNQTQPAIAVAVPVSPVQSTTPPVVQSQVRPALPAAAPVPQPAISPVQTQAQTHAPVHPASAAPAPALWVQIAAVSHDEDAQVLSDALKKRGYGVTSRRQSDNLVHVRIGPFNTRDEANQWRTKLLDDGYNAEVQQ